MKVERHIYYCSYTLLAGPLAVATGLQLWKSVKPTVGAKPLQLQSLNTRLVEVILSKQWNT